jgi:competence protein ComEC
MISQFSPDPFLMQSQLQKNPQPAGLLLLWWPVFLSIGIGWFFCLDTIPQRWLGPGLLGSIIALISASRRWRYNTVWRWLMHGLFAAALGFCLIQWETQRADIAVLHYPSFSQPLQGTIESAEKARGGWRVVLKDVTFQKDENARYQKEEYDTRNHYRLRISIKQKNFIPEFGSRIALKASLIAPSPALLPGMFDFRRYAFYQGFSGYGYSNAPVTVLERPKTAFPTLDHYRQYIAQRVKVFLEKTKLKPPVAVAGLTTALLNGQRAGIDKVSEENMQRSGLQHLISISGLHVSLLAGLVFFVVRLGLALSMHLALTWPIKKIAAGVALVTIVIYMLIIGLSAPTVRSVLMTSVVLMAVILDREAITLRLVAIAAILILLIEPESLITPGFQMSFSAVAALVVFYQKSIGFWQNPRWRQNIFYRILFVFMGSAATTIVASIATAPLAIYHFQQLPLLSVIANALVTPIMAFVVMPASLLAYLTLPFDYLGQWMVWYMGWGVEKILQIAAWVAQSDMALWRVRGLQTPHIVLITFGTLWLMLIKAKKAWLGLVPIIAGLVAAFFTPQPVLALIPSAGRAVIYAPLHGDTVYYDGRLDKFTQDLLVQYLAKDKAEPLPLGIKLPKDIYIARTIEELNSLCGRPERIIVTRWYMDQKCKGKEIIDRHQLNEYREGIVVVY